MQCRDCGYSLWNIPPGRCPECGKAFAPTGFTFRLRAVKFLCPNCRQEYYGTDLQGLPVPRSFMCVNCGEPVEADQMIVLPAEGVSERMALAEAAPWRMRTNIGLWKAFWKTVGRSLTRPASVVRWLPPEGGLAEALGFACLAGLFVTLVGTLLVAAVLLPIGFFTGGGRGMLSPLLFLSSGCVGASIVYLVVGVALWAVLAHLVLLVTGKRAGGFRLTYRTMLYAQGPIVFVLIPSCGSYIAGAWMTVSCALMLRESQGVHGARATAAALTLPVLAIIAYAAFIITAVTIASTVSTMSVSGPTMPLSSVAGFGQGPAGAITAAASPDDGSGPDHVLRLVADGSLSVDDLTDPWAGPPATSILIGEQTLASIGLQPPGEIDQLANALAAERDEAASWYIFVGTVFCYDGLDLRTTPPDGHSDVLGYILGGSGNEGPGQPRKYTVWFADGSWQRISRSEISNLIARENEHRASRGVPAIPLPEEAVAQ
ncbi:MAG: YIP1 family protein [Phycisphaerales bacterium]|nr:YIP1 family protein [Phycisphaerales bacterium]